MHDMAYSRFLDFNINHEIHALLCNQGNSTFIAEIYIMETVALELEARNLMITLQMTQKIALLAEGKKVTNNIYSLFSLLQPKTFLLLNTFFFPLQSEKLNNHILKPNNPQRCFESLTV